ADTQKPKVILHPGTSRFAAFKRWPIQNFVELARRLRSQQISVAMSYGPGEIELFRTAKAAVPDLIEIDGPSLGLLGLGQAMRQADVVVAADTGPLHIAAGVGTRVVALFGPKDSKLYGPRGEGHLVLQHDVPCRPCKLRTCPSPQCVLGIQVQQVEHAVGELTQG
ncbi:MAG: glycosyltransferase family 9 protein, partial [Planctomycetota bacterium]|nr:glycosyltransferase family 9 protein [Planctomycetota bacterium]